jgi:hypothetical protein
MMASREPLNDRDLIERLETSYGVALPHACKTFLLEGAYRRCRTVELRGFIQGRYDLDFLDEELSDVVELGLSAGIHDMEDVPWSETYADYVPLASMAHPDVEEPRMFLVLDVVSEGNPVLLFEHEEWRLYPLSDGFDSFLRDLPTLRTDHKLSFKP